MIYKVIGERIPTSRFDQTTPEVDRNVREFDNYTDASDYYTLTFGQVSEDLTDLGGEFVMTLVATKEDNSVEVLKRHVASTTILL
jgi:hypothetical protein